MDNIQKEIQEELLKQHDKMLDRFYSFINYILVFSGLYLAVFSLTNTKVELKVDSVENSTNWSSTRHTWVDTNYSVNAFGRLSDNTTSVTTDEIYRNIYAVLCIGFVLLAFVIVIFNLLELCKYNCLKKSSADNSIEYLEGNELKEQNAKLYLSVQNKKKHYIIAISLIAFSLAFLFISKHSKFPCNN